MKKPIFRTILSLLLVCSLLWGCTPAQQTSSTTEPATEPSKGIYSQTLSEELRAEIVALYGERKGDDENTVAGFHFCGTYDGYTFLLSDSMLTVITKFEVGGYSFFWPTHMRIWAVKNGEEYGLQKLYDGGTITDQDLGQIYENYMVHYQDIYGR